MSCHLSSKFRVKEPFFVKSNIGDSIRRDSAFYDLLQPHVDTLNIVREDSTTLQLSKYEIGALLNYIDDLNKRLSVHSSNTKALKKVKIRPNKKKI